MRREGRREAGREGGGRRERLRKCERERERERQIEGENERETERERETITHAIHAFWSSSKSDVEEERAACTYEPDSSLIRFDTILCWMLSRMLRGPTQRLLTKARPAGTSTKRCVGTASVRYQCYLLIIRVWVVKRANRHAGTCVVDGRAVRTCAGMRVG